MTQENEKIHLGSAVSLNKLCISTFTQGGRCSCGQGHRWKELECIITFEKDLSLRELSISPPSKG